MREKLYLERVIEQIQKDGIAPIDDGAQFRLKLERLGVLMALAVKKSLGDKKLFDGDELCGPLHSWGFVEHYLQGKANIYRIAPKFGEHLDRTKLKIPASVLPYKEGQYYLIELPKRFYDETTDDYHRAVIIYSGKSVELTIPGTKHKVTSSFTSCPTGVTFLFPDEDRNGDLKHTFSYIRFDPYMHGPAGTIDSIIESREVSSNTHGEVHSAEYLKRLVGFTMKCWLYIESGEPDLVPEKGFVPTTHNPKKLRKQLRDHFPADIVNVGYSLHHRHYTVDETSVVGHYRWQPFGPGRTKVRLIWIDEHSRRYEKSL